MRWLIHLAVRGYPRRWRERYGAEFHALIDDLSPAWPVLFDVLRGGVSMRMRTSNLALLAASFGVVGAIAGGIGAFAAPAQFESHGTMVATAAGASPDVDAALLAAWDRAVEAEFAAGTGVRRKIAVVRTPRSNALQVSSVDPDPRRAQQVTEALMTRVIQTHAQGSAGIGRATGVQLRIVERPNLPESPARPYLVWLIGAGFGGGAIIGAAIGLVRRRRAAK
jgi:uncharacterized protein involved in exopolysaccharide biosynthesis